MVRSASKSGGRRSRQPKQQPEEEENEEQKAINKLLSCEGACSAPLMHILSTQRGRFRHLYLEAEQQAEHNREREYRAAVTIQSAWRGYKEREAIEHLHTAAITIQRAFRGLQGRKHFRATVKGRLRDLRVSHYSQCAARIQAVWKGYAHRKHGLDFYARKRYLETLRKHNDEIKRELTEFEQEQAARRQEEREKAEKKKRLRELERQHVFLSTRAQPGVLSKQGRDVEVTVRTVNKLQTLKKPRPPPSLPRHRTAPAPIDRAQLYDKPQGPFKPPERVVRMKTRPLRGTLKRAEPYSSPVDPAKIFERSTRDLPDNRPRFAEFTKSHAHTERYEPSVFAPTHYVGEGPGDERQVYGRRTFRAAEEKVDAQSRLAFSTVGRIHLFDETEAEA